MSNVKVKNMQWARYDEQKAANFIAVEQLFHSAALCEINHKNILKYLSNEGVERASFSLISSRLQALGAATENAAKVEQTQSSNLLALLLMWHFHRSPCQSTAETE